MSTYNLVTFAAAIENRKRQSELTAKEAEDYAVEKGLVTRSKALEGVESRLTAVRKEMYAMNADKLNLKIKYFQGRDDLAYKLKKLSLEDQWREKDLLSRTLKKHADTKQKLLDDRNTEDMQATRRLKGLYEEKIKSSGVKAPIAMFKSLTDLNLDEDSKDLVNPGVKRGQANSMRIWMDKINAAVPGDRQIFDMSGPSDKVLNLDALKNADDPQNPLRLAGLSRGSVITAFEPEGSSLFDQYNEHQEASYKALKMSEGHIADIRAAAEGFSTAGSPAELRAHRDIVDDLVAFDEVFTKGSGIDTANLDQLPEELLLYQSAKRSEQRLEKLATELATKDPSAAVQLRNQMARRMASPYVRAWARDNGFDELGHVTITDGKYDPASYIPGRDDKAVARAFNRQAARGAGRYGFKSIGSGDIVQVNVDGSPVVGERLKYHAGDRVGTVRVMTETGEIMTFAPGEVDQVVVIERRPDRVSPLVNRAKGRSFQMRDQIQAARERAGVAVPGSEDNAFMTGDGNYVIDDDTGRYIDELEHNQKLDEFVSHDTIDGKVVDGKEYLVKRLDGTMYEFVVAEDGSSQLIPVADKDLAAKIQQAPTRRVVGTFDVEGQDEPLVRMLGRTDTDFSGLDLVFEPLEGEENYSDETDQYFNGQEKTKRSRVGLNSLGYKETDQKFSPMAGQTYKNEYVVGGVKYVDLDQAPPLPPSRSEALTPGVDGPAEQPTGMPGITAEIEEAARQQRVSDLLESGPKPGRDIKSDPVALDLSETDVDARGEIEFDADAARQNVEDEDIRRTWNAAATKAMEDGGLPPEIPDGWEVVQGEGLQKISEDVQRAGTPQPPPTSPAADLDTSALDLEAITGTPQQPPAPTPTPAPKPSPAPTPPSDAELDAMTTPESDEDRKKREEEQAARIAQIQAMTARLKGKDKGKGKKPDAKLPDELEAVLEATPESQEEADKEAKSKSDKSFKLLNELIVDESEDSGNVLLSEKFDQYLEASKAEGLTVQQATQRLRVSLSNYEDGSGKPIPLKLVDGEVVRVDPPPIDEDKPPEDPLGQKLKEVDEEDAVAAQVRQIVGDPPEPKVKLTPEQEAAEKAATLSKLGSTVEEMKSAGAGKFVSSQDKAKRDVASATSALSFLDAMSEGVDKDADTVQAEGDMSSSGIVPGKSTADSVKQMDNMLKRMEQFKKDADAKRSAEDGFQQGLDTMGAYEPPPASDLSR